MKKTLLFVLLAAMAFTASAVEKVTVEDLQQNGWKAYQGKHVQITTPLYICGLYYDSLVLAPQRLHVPEEYAVGLADGDSTELFRLREVNEQMKIVLHARLYSHEWHTGTVVKNLQAQVVGERQLLTGSTPKISKKPLPKKMPSIKGATLTICSANIQNFFYDLGGYAGAKTRPQFDLQCLKVATALTRIDADLYTLCELEKGSKAPSALVDKMNQLAHKDIYAFVDNGVADGDTISVGFVYRKDKVRPYGDTFWPYTDQTNIYANRFMIHAFEEIASGERFIISLNHPRSKRGEPAIANQKRMANIDSILTAIDAVCKADLYDDPDIILLGDYNCYTQEEPLQTLIRKGFVDLVMRDDAEGYSYVYNSEAGYLDRAFANPSMAEQVVCVHPYHVNTDCYYSSGYRSKYNYKNNNVPISSPKQIKKMLSSQGKKNLIYRYSDHDPLIIGLKLGKQVQNNEK